MNHVIFLVTRFTASKTSELLSTTLNILADVDSNKLWNCFISKISINSHSKFVCSKCFTILSNEDILFNWIKAFSGTNFPFSIPIELRSIWCYSLCEQRTVDLTVQSIMLWVESVHILDWNWCKKGGNIKRQIVSLLSMEFEYIKAKKKWLGRVLKANSLDQWQNHTQWKCLYRLEQKKNLCRLNSIASVGRDACVYNGYANDIGTLMYSSILYLVHS